MRFFPVLVMVAAIPMLAIAAPASADGTVTRATGCGDKIYAAGVNGFAVLVASGPGTVADGDELKGDFEKIGHVVLFDRTSGRSVSAVVEERGLDKPQIERRIATNCRSLVANTFVSGKVERTEGCGNKIFVDTPKGIAVLERIAGGVVSTGDILTGNFNRPGRATVQVRQTSGTMTVFVEDFQLSRSAAQRKMDASCRR